MTKKTMFQRMLEALVEGRDRTAQRYVDRYLKDHDIAPRPTGNEGFTRR